MKKDSLLRPVIVLSVICLITTLLLAATNVLTSPVIQKLEEESRNQQMEKIFPDGASFDAVSLTSEQTKVLTSRGGDIDQVFVAKNKDGSVIGYVFIASSNGYAGKVTASVGIDPKGDVVMAAFKAPDDTPGLGKRVEEDAFASEFAKLPADRQISVNGAGDTEPVDAISGATISSKGAVNAINHILTAFTYLVAEGNL